MQDQRGGSPDVDSAPSQTGRLWPMDFRSSIEGSSSSANSVCSILASRHQVGGSHRCGEGATRPASVSNTVVGAEHVKGRLSGQQRQLPQQVQVHVFGRGVQRAIGAARRGSTRRPVAGEGLLEGSRTGMAGRIGRGGRGCRGQQDGVVLPAVCKAPE